MTYADETPEVNPQSQGMLDMLYFFIDAGITKKEPTDGDALSKELDQPAQELLHGILETAPPRPTLWRSAADPLRERRAIC